MGEYTVHLVGESKYQDAIGFIWEGQTIELVPEPTNRFDKRAIKAVSRLGATVGYIERDSWVTGLILDQRADVFARVKHITGGGPGQQKGVVLNLWTAANAEAARAQPDPRPRAGCIGMAAMIVMAGLAAVMVPGKARADQSFAGARARNAAYCLSINQGKACTARQNSEMAHFVKMMAGFRLSRAEVRACMERGKRGRYIDWTVATPCLRQKVKGRPIGG